LGIGAAGAERTVESREGARVESPEEDLLDGTRDTTDQSLVVVYSNQDGGLAVGLLSWIVLGLIAGWVASKITGRTQGCWLNVVVGVVGAFLGGILMQLITGRGFDIGFNLPSLAVAVIGAVILLAIAGLAVRTLR
jgi:uncharacterized membrane protein YeaQ/YmgE (transglycosylase-associated protein family)